MIEIKGITAEQFISMVDSVKWSIYDLVLCDVSKVDFSQLFDNMIEKTQNAIDVLIRLTGKTECEAYDLLTKSLMEKEDDRKEFCERYNLPHEHDNI